MAFEQTSGSLFGLDGEIKEGKVVDFKLPEAVRKDLEPEIFYFIDFTKLSNVNELIVVLQALGFGLSNKHPHFDTLQKFLDLDKPVKLK
jgi:hypothetical protein